MYPQKIGGGNGNPLELSYSMNINVGSTVTQTIPFGETFSEIPNVALTLPDQDAVALYVSALTTSSVTIRGRNYYSAARSISGKVYVIPN